MDCTLSRHKCHPMEDGLYKCILAYANSTKESIKALLDYYRNRCILQNKSPTGDPMLFSASPVLHGHAQYFKTIVC